MTDHKCKVSTQSLSNLHSFFKSGFVCANVPLPCMIWRRRSEQQLTTVIASPSAAIHLSMFFSPMSLFLLLLTCTSFLHVCLWYSFAMIRRRTSMIIVRVDIAYCSCICSGLLPHISLANQLPVSHLRESKSIGQKFCQPNKVHLSFQVKRIVNYFLSWIMMLDSGHLHTDKGLLPVPTTNRDITKSLIHTSAQGRGHLHWQGSTC